MDADASDWLIARRNKNRNEFQSLQFENVSYRYPNSDKFVLRHINITISKGDSIMIVGENGSGKSTFVKLLMRLYDPDQGEILINGINIKQFLYEEYLAMYASVFQDFKLFAFSVRDNITSLGSSCDDKAAEAARKAEIAERIEKLPQKYESYCTKCRNTAFFISHRLSGAKFCDKILVIKGGENIEFGTHEELMAKNGIYKEMFSKQADYYV